MKICVVEDELTIREGIILKLSMMTLPHEIFDVEYGMKAVERLLMIKPNLVFLDIYMPEINGLDMLRLIKDRLPNTRFVILTGYGEFQYAQQALQLGVKNYLLKPVYNNDLQTVVEEVHQELVKETEAELKLDIRLFGQVGYPIRITGVSRPGWWLDDYKLKAIIWGTEKVQQQLEKCIFHFHVDNLGPGAVIAVERNETTQGCFYKRNEWGKHLHDVIDLISTCRFFGEEEVDAARRMARSDTKALSSVIQLRSEMITAIGSSPTDLRLIKERLERWTELIGRFGRTPLKEECVQLLSSLDGALQNRDQRFIVEADKENWKNWVSMFDEWESLRDRISYLVNKGLSELQGLAEVEKLTDQEIVDRIRDLVENDPDYHELSLSRMAERFHIHPVTLSRFFKKKTGINFIQYLTEQKMNRAKEMLLQTPKKVNQIAEELGYSNYRYFSKLFKEKFGIIPQQLRKYE
jgi:two-component system response regulator YesN